MSTPPSASLASPHASASASASSQQQHRQRGQQRPQLQAQGGSGLRGAGTRQAAAATATDAATAAGYHTGSDAHYRRHADADSSDVRGSRHVRGGATERAGEVSEGVPDGSVRERMLISHPDGPLRGDSFSRPKRHKRRQLASRRHGTLVSLFAEEADVAGGQSSETSFATSARGHGAVQADADETITGLSYGEAPIGVVRGAGRRGVGARARIAKL